MVESLTRVGKAMTKNKKLIMLFIVTLLLSTFGFIHVQSKKVEKIQIGVISSWDSAYYSSEAFFEEIIEPDINAYCAKLPRHRFHPTTEFDFIVTNAEGSTERHLELVQEFHEQGIDLIIGGGWSSMAMASLEYVNENGMLLMSASSTLIPLAISGDNLYRLSPNDLNQAVAIAEMLVSKGIDSIIVLQRDDDWGAGLYEALALEFEYRGGNILERLVYPGDTTDFSSYLQQAEDTAVAASDNVAIQLISFAETVNIIGQSIHYTTIYNLDWFGCDGTVFMQQILDEVPSQAAHLKIFSTTPAPEYSSKYMEMAQRYEELTGLRFTYYSACTVDAAWIIAMAVLETRSSSGSPVLSAIDVIKVVPDVASRYYGYSGWCLLNEAGDRYASNYDIWGYGMIDGEPSFVYYGYYNSITGIVIWQ